LGLEFIKEEKTCRHLSIELVQKKIGGEREEKREELSPSYILRKFEVG